MEFAQKKLRIELSYDLAFQLLSIYPKEMKSLSWRDICTNLFIIALLNNNHNMETTWVSIDEWMDKIYYIYIYLYIVHIDILYNMYIYTHTKWTIISHKKQRNPAICNKMDGS